VCHRWERARLPPEERARLPPGERARLPPGERARLPAGSVLVCPPDGRARVPLVLGRAGVPRWWWRGWGWVVIDAR
jgi:hypothetical protein